MLSQYSLNIYFLYFLFFMLGAAIASFVSVVIDRKNKNFIGINKRSECDECKNKLKFYELVPVFSYLFFLGKCKNCKSKIPLKLFFMEVILGSWFLFTIINAYDFFILFLQLIFGIIFSMLVYEDMKDMEVSSSKIYLLLSISIPSIIYTILNGANYLNLILSLLFSLPFWIIYLINKQAVGEADPYVFTALNIFFGAQVSISLFLYSIWLGAFYGIFYLYFINKKFERGIRIPFLPIIFVAMLFILATSFHIIKMTDILLINEILFAK